MKPIRQLLNAVKSIKGSSFASLLYSSKGSGEVARHQILLGCDLENAYRADLATLAAKLPTLKGVAQVACQEMIQSLSTSLVGGIGNNPAYTCKDAFEPIAPGIKLCLSTGELHLTGFSIGKEVYTPGTPKPGPKSAKAKAKAELRKGLKSARFRSFTVPGMAFATLQGSTIAFAD